MHKRDRDFETIKGFTKAVLRVHNDLCEEVIRGDYYAAISTGDLHHSGYKSNAASLSHRNRHQRLTNAVNGNHYICRGNHMFLERDTNPTLYMIQPHPTVKPMEDFFAEEPVIKSPDYVIIDDVQISLFHYDKDNKNYFRKREPGIKTHIAIFHDSCTLPQSVRDEIHQHTRVESDYLRAVYADIDMAIFGHIHTRIGWRTVKTGEREVPIYIPGSLGITSSKEVERHSEVNLPILKIEGAKVTIEYLKQKTYVETLEFYKTDKAIIKQQVNNTMQNESSDFAHIKDVDIKRILDSKLDLVTYMRERGHTEKSINLVTRASEGDLKIVDVVGIYQGKVFV